jgi:hypothetical protein
MAANKRTRSLATPTAVETKQRRKRSVVATTQLGATPGTRAQAWSLSSDADSILEAFSIDLDADLDL